MTNKQKAVVLDVERLQDRYQSIDTDMNTDGMKGELYRILVFNILDGDYSTPAPSPQYDFAAEVYCFMRWLTTRPEPVALGANYECGTVAELIGLYFEENKIPQPKNDSVTTHPSRGMDNIKSNITAIEKAQEGQRRHVVVSRVDTGEYRRIFYAVIDQVNKEVIRDENGITWHPSEELAQAQADKLDGVVVEEWSLCKWSKGKEAWAFKRNGKSVTFKEVLGLLNEQGGGE